MNINEVKHDMCDWSSDTSLYFQSAINVLNACHFTYSPKTQQEHNFRKSSIISYWVNAWQLNFLKIFCYHILSSHKSLAQINKCKIFALYDFPQWTLYNTIYSMIHTPRAHISICRHVHWIHPQLSRDGRPAGSATPLGQGQSLATHPPEGRLSPKSDS